MRTQSMQLRNQNLEIELNRNADGRRNNCVHVFFSIHPSSIDQDIAIGPLFSILTKHEISDLSFSFYILTFFDQKKTLLSRKQSRYFVGLSHFVHKMSTFYVWKPYILLSAIEK